MIYKMTKAERARVYRLRKIADIRTLVMNHRQEKVSSLEMIDILSNCFDYCFHRGVLRGLKLVEERSKRKE